MKKVLLLLAKGFESFEASAFIDIIGWNLIDGDKTTTLFTCGMTKEVKGSFHIVIKTDFIIEDIIVEEFDALAVPGGFEEYGFYEDAYHEKFLDLIRKFHKNNKIIASICVGALPIAKAGLLSKVNATTYNLNNGLRQKQLEELGAIIVNQPIVYDNNIITSWNPSTAVSVALMLLENLTSKENATQLKQLMGF